MVPLQSHQMRLRHVTDADARWLLRALRKVGGRFGSRFDRASDGSLRLRR